MNRREMTKTEQYNDYAQMVVSAYKRYNHGELPTQQNSLGVAQIVREYNSDLRSFKILYGYSIRGHVEAIAERVSAICKGEEI